MPNLNFAEALNFLELGDQIYERDQRFTMWGIKAISFSIKAYSPNHFGDSDDVFNSIEFLRFG
jgi:hypothetical protein